MYSKSLTFTVCLQNFSNLFQYASFCCLYGCWLQVITHSDLLLCP